MSEHKPTVAGPDARLLSAERIAEIRRDGFPSHGEVLVLGLHIDALTERLAEAEARAERLVDLVQGMAKFEPYAEDNCDVWCVVCCEHSADGSFHTEQITHATDCLWVRAQALASEPPAETQP